MSNPFGTNSRKILSGLHPDLQRLMIRVNQVVQCTLVSGGRTKMEQADFFYGTNKTGVNPEKKKLTKTLESRHLIQDDGYAHAVDAGPDVNNVPSFKDADLLYFSGVVKGVADMMGIRVRLGADWDQDGIVTDETFIDRDHIELVD